MVVNYGIVIDDIMSVINKKVSRLKMRSISSDRNISYMANLELKFLMERLVVVTKMIEEGEPLMEDTVESLINMVSSKDYEFAKGAIEKMLSEIKSVGKVKPNHRSKIENIKKLNYEQRHRR